MLFDVQGWEEDRGREMKECLQTGVIPYTKDVALMEDKAKGATARKCTKSSSPSELLASLKM